MRPENARPCRGGPSSGRLPLPVLHRPLQKERAGRGLPLPAPIRRFCPEARTVLLPVPNSIRQADRFRMILSGGPASTARNPGPGRDRPALPYGFFPESAGHPFRASAGRRDIPARMPALPPARASAGMRSLPPAAEAGRPPADPSGPWGCRPCPDPPLPRRGLPGAAPDGAGAGRRDPEAEPGARGPAWSAPERRPCLRKPVCLPCPVMIPQKQGCPDPVWENTAGQ